MTKKEANTDIRCRVASCVYHMQDKDYCGLSSIHVEPCQMGSTGKPEDESMCGSYKSK